MEGTDICPPRAQPPPRPQRYQDSMFVTVEEPTLTQHHYQPESVVYIREV